MLSSVILLLVVCNIAYASVSSDLIVYYNLDEGLGTTVVDSSGNSYDGVLTGGDWVIGKYVYGVEFDGSSDILTVASPPTLGIGDFTLSCWILTSNTGDFKRIIDNSAWGGDGFAFYLRASGALACEIAGNEFVSSGETVNDGEAHMVSVVVERAVNMTFYKDGVAYYTVDISGVAGSVTTAYDWGIAASTLSGDNLACILDEIRVYNTAKTSSDILELYNYDPTAPEYSSEEIIGLSIALTITFFSVVMVFALVRRRDKN